jgi:hypothetical protein
MEPLMSASTQNSKSDLFTMRLPREHREKLMTAAKASNRSLANYLVDAGLVLAGRKPEAVKPPAVELAI